MVILNRANAGIEIEELAQSDVQRTDAPANRGGQRTLDADAQLAKGSDRVIGQPGLEAVHGLFAGEDFVPGDPALTVIGNFNCRIEYPDRRFPDITAGAVAFDERNDGMVWDNKLTVCVSDLGPAGGQRYFIIRSRHKAPRGV